MSVTNKKNKAITNGHKVCRNTARKGTRSLLKNPLKSSLINDSNTGRIIAMLKHSKRDAIAIKKINNTNLFLNTPNRSQM